MCRTLPAPPRVKALVGVSEHVILGLHEKVDSGVGSAQIGLYTGAVAQESREGRDQRRVRAWLHV
jgi:hypothetical protein